VTKQALDEAIKVCRPGVAYREIGGVINDIADKAKLGVRVCISSFGLLQDRVCIMFP
jgi:methionine aminopeptidase